MVCALHFIANWPLITPKHPAMSQVPSTMWVASITNESWPEEDWMSIHTTAPRAQAALHNKMAQQVEEQQYSLIDPVTKRVPKETSAEKLCCEWEYMTRGDSKWNIKEVAVDANDEVQFVSRPHKASSQ